MAMKKCKECAKEVSTSAKVCPHCGKQYPTGGLIVPVKIFIGIVLLIILIGIVLLIILGRMFGTQQDISKPRLETALPPHVTEPTRDTVPRQANMEETVSFQLLDEEILDLPQKAQITQSILASGVIDEHVLRDELIKRFSVIADRRGFIYYAHPTHIFIYVYGSLEQFRSGKDLWVGMLAYGPWGNGTPKIDISKDRLNALYSSPEKRHGLSEEIRKKIYKENAMFEEKARTVSKNEIPEDNIMERIDRQIDLAEKYKREICKKYSISDDQLMDILAEGVRKGWPR